MPIRTPICDALGIEVPIFGMTHSVAAVAEISRCGGFGVYGAVRDVPEEMPGKLAAVRDSLGSAGFGVDIILPRLGVATRRREEVEEAIPAAHRAFVEGLRRKYGVPDATEAGFRSRLVRSDELWEAQIDVALASDAVMFACGAGASRDAIKRAKALGKITAAVIGTPKHARAVLDAGVDVVVAQGYDAGGHTGSIGTMTLGAFRYLDAPRTPSLRVSHANRSRYSLGPTLWFRRKARRIVNPVQTGPEPEPTLVMYGGNQGARSKRTVTQA